MYNYLQMGAFSDSKLNSDFVQNFLNGIFYDTIE